MVKSPLTRHIFPFDSAPLTKIANGCTHFPLNKRYQTNKVTQDASTIGQYAFGFPTLCHSLAILFHSYKTIHLVHYLFNFLFLFHLMLLFSFFTITLPYLRLNIDCLVINTTIPMSV
jgi:hypothetical protein